MFIHNNYIFFHKPPYNSRCGPFLSGDAFLNLINIIIEFNFKCSIKTIQIIYILKFNNNTIYIYYVYFNYLNYYNFDKIH